MKLKNIYTIPFVLLAINVLLCVYVLIVFIGDARHDYSSIILLAPVVALISMFYMWKFIEVKNTPLVRLLRTLNWIFILVPIIAFAAAVLLMIG